MSEVEEFLSHTLRIKRVAVLFLAAARWLLEIVGNFMIPAAKTAFD